MRFGFQLGFDRSGNRGGRPSLNFGAVAIIIGDSNAAGSAQTASENAFAASYVPDPKIRTVNTAGALVTWTPNVHCGLRSLADSGRPGYEAGFVQRWKQDFPNDPLVILRFGNPGACASRGPTTGTMTASFSGNQVTRTAGVALTTTQLLRGTGLAGPNGRGIHTLFQNGGNANNWYVGEVRNAANINLGTLASFTFDTYNAFLSWSLNEGDIYNGLSNNPTGGVRARVSAALSALTSQGYNPRVVAVGNWIGANDVATTEAAGLYQAAVTELYTDMRSTWSLEP